MRVPSVPLMVTDVCSCLRDVAREKLMMPTALLGRLAIIAMPSSPCDLVWTLGGCAA